MLHAYNECMHIKWVNGTSITQHLAVAPQEFDVRLVGGEEKTEGRVEIFYQGEWGTVCDDFWDLKDATVVCRQLGYPAAIRKSTFAEFGQGSGPIHLDNVNCQGDEAILRLCDANDFGVNDCGHDEDAGVVCSGKFKELLHFCSNFNFTLVLTLCMYCAYTYTYVVLYRETCLRWSLC